MAPGDGYLGAGAGQGWRGDLYRLPPALASGPDTLALLHALRRRWLLALSLGLILAGAAAGAAWYLFATKYTAFAQIQIAATQDQLMAGNGNAGGGQREFLTYQRTQAQQIKSRFVLNKALTRDDVKKLRVVNKQPDPLVWLEEELKVDFQEGSELITVTMSGPEADEVIALVDAVTKAYVKEVVEAERERRRNRVDQLDKIYIEASAKLGKKKEALRQMADYLGTSDSGALTQKQLNLLTYLGDLKRQHGQARAELMKAQARLETHKTLEKAAKDPPLQETALSQALEADPVAKRQLTLIARHQEIIADYQQNAVRSNEGTRVHSEQKVKELQKKLAARKEELRKELTEALRQRARSEFDTTLVQLQKEVELWVQPEKGLRAEVDSLTAKAEQIGRSTIAFEQLRSEINREEGITDKVGRDAGLLRVELGSEPRVRLYQEAALQKKDMKYQVLATILAAVVALGGVCFYVSWSEFRTRRIRTTEEVVAGLGIPVVGAVPALAEPGRQVPSGSGADQEVYEHSLLESIDGIRTMLLRDASVAGLGSVMVTSAVSGEGKTTLASQLASSLARAGRKTLLIDCDLRRPAAHQLFEVPAQPGLSEVLLGEVHVAEATRSTAVSGLWMIPAGQWDRQVIQALARDGVQKIFAKIKQEYDFVVVDSHPVLLANDAVVIGLHVDAVILSLMRDVSQMPRVYAACQRLTSLGIRVLGAVMNGMPEEDMYGTVYRQDKKQPAR